MVASSVGPGFIYKGWPVKRLLNKSAFLTKVVCYSKVSKGTKIRNRYNQVPHLTQDLRQVKFIHLIFSNVWFYKCIFCDTIRPKCYLIKCSS